MQTQNVIESPFEDRELPQGNVTKSTFDVKNYLNTRLGPGETKRQIFFRLIPISPNSNKMTVPVEIHSMKVDKEVAKSGFKSFICLNDPHLENHDSRGCPLCNKVNELFEKANQYPQGDDVRRALCREAYKLRDQHKIVYIARGIERGKEDEGVKFWRFNKYKNGNGIYDSLLNIYEQRQAEAKMAGVCDNYNVFDLYNGHDIVLTITRSEKDGEQNGDKTEISIMDSSFQTPLSNDPNKINEWINDPKDWREMYTTKSYDYLQIIANGGIPYFDRANQKWVDKELMRKQNEAADQYGQQILNNSSFDGVNGVVLPPDPMQGNDLPF